jgi:two-component system chemotaxis sensor kinase CheA
VGHIVLRAFHEGGQVNIEISDDGAGIDPDKVRERAVQRGMITAEKAARMTDRELVNLIFAAGFSTAEHVTNVSGRGVGMDVVKTNVEKIGGTLDLNSRPGEGTSLRIKIPLTLAIIPALIVRSQAERYAIPQISLLELVRLEAAQARTAIELIHGAPVYRLRGNLLPLVYLCVALGRPPRARDDESPVNIVVLQADDRQFGLVVDGVSDTEEIVVKPLGKELSALTAFAGATIMGDGKVALILDVVGIAQRSNVVAGARDRSLFEKAAHAASTTEEKKALLLFRVDDKQRLAMELSTVARLEEFPRSKVERAGQLDVVQYRGEILPLIDLRSVLGCGAEEADGAPLQVVVYTERGRSVGLVVARILDIVEETLNVKRSSSTEGLLGAAVIQGQVTDLLDVHGVIRARVPAFFDDQDAA